MENKRKSNKQIVTEVAAIMFLENGFTYTSMDEVVEESGVSKSNVYYHFTSKEELLLSVIDFWSELYKENIEKIILIPKLSVKEKFICFLDLLGNTIEERNYQGSCPFISFIVQTPKNDLKVNDKIESFFSYLTTVCADLIQQGIEEGEFRKDLNSKSAAEVFVNNLEGALFLTEVRKDKSIITNSTLDFFRLLV